jgi:DNA-binding transcriptional LysR family regulator
MDINRLRIFCEVYRQRGFSTAARRLGLTQSAVSQQVKALERELGVELFEPDSRSIPTAAGDYLHREAGLILAAVDDVRRGVREVGGVGAGSVKFGMIDVAAIELMPGVLASFKRDHPHVKVEAVVRTSGELIDMVEGHELDFAVAVTNRVPEGLATRPIYSDSIVAVVPKGSPFAGGKISLGELRGEPLILYPRSSHSRMLIDEIFRSHGVVPTVAMEMHYPEAICSLVQQGMGVGLISELSARENKLRGQSVVAVREFAGIRKIGMVSHRRRRPAPQAVALMEAIGAAQGYPSG